MDFEKEVIAIREEVLTHFAEDRATINATLSVAHGYILKALQKAFEAGLMEAEKIAVKKRITDKYPKCCKQAMVDNSISTAQAIRQRIKEK